MIRDQAKSLRDKTIIIVNFLRLQNLNTRSYSSESDSDQLQSIHHSHVTVILVNGAIVLSRVFLGTKGS